MYLWKDRCPENTKKFYNSIKKATKTGTYVNNLNSSQKTNGQWAHEKTAQTFILRGMKVKPWRDTTA